MMESNQCSHIIWLGVLLVAVGAVRVVLCVEHPALGVMLNASLDLDTEETITVTEDDYKAHFLKRGKGWEG